MHKYIFVVLVFSILVGSGFLFQQIFLTSFPKLDQSTIQNTPFQITTAYPDLEGFNNCVSGSGKLKIDREFEFSSVKLIMAGNEKPCSIYNYYSKLQYDETLLLVGACVSTKGSEGMNLVDLKFVQKKLGVVVDPNSI